MENTAEQRSRELGMFTGLKGVQAFRGTRSRVLGDDQESPARELCCGCETLRRQMGEPG